MGCKCNHSKKTETSTGEASQIDPNDVLVVSTDPNHPANVICELCRSFFNNGWCTGTGGGVSVKEEDRIFIAPSGVQKERMNPTDMFVMSSSSGDYLRKPVLLKPSLCTPLFLSVYKLRKSGACIHTHSQAAVLITFLYDKVFRITNIEQIKAVPRVSEPGYLKNTDVLEIPIVENTEREEELTEELERTLLAYPNAPAVLVRGHGIHVWGETVWKAKIINEAIDYVLELAVKMHQLGIPTIKEDK